MIKSIHHSVIQFSHNLRSFLDAYFQVEVGVRAEWGGRVGRVDGWECRGGRQGSSSGRHEQLLQHWSGCSCRPPVSSEQKLVEPKINKLPLTVAVNGEWPQMVVKGRLNAWTPENNKLAQLMLIISTVAVNGQSWSILHKLRSLPAVVFSWIVRFWDSGLTYATYNSVGYCYW